MEPHGLEARQWLARQGGRYTCLACNAEATDEHVQSNGHHAKLREFAAALRCSVAARLLGPPEGASATAASERVKGEAPSPKAAAGGADPE